MATIDVGAGATNRANILNFTGVYTRLSLDNPANDTGVLDTFEIWATGKNLSNTKIGTFSGNGTDYTSRDYESIGTVTNGSKQTFTGKNCDVSSGDILGVVCSPGTLEADNTGGAGVRYYISGDAFDGASHTYGLLSGMAISLYATGATVAAGSLPLKNVFGRPFRGVFR